MQPRQSAQEEHMYVPAEVHGDLVIYRLPGCEFTEKEIDAFINQAKTRVAGGTKALVLNLERFPHITSATMSVIVGCCRLVEDHQRFGIVDPRGRAERMLRETRLGLFIRSYPTEYAAIRGTAVS